MKVPLKQLRRSQMWREALKIHLMVDSLKKQSEGFSRSDQVQTCGGHHPSQRDRSEWDARRDGPPGCRRSSNVWPQTSPEGRVTVRRAPRGPLRPRTSSLLLAAALRVRRGRRSQLHLLLRQPELRLREQRIRGSPGRSHR